MKIKQNVRHFAAKQALTLPVVGPRVRERLVDLHVDVFGEKAADGHRAEREAHMEAFFDNTFDTYVAALEAGYPEAEAREITHVQANFDFYNHGWTEMMEFPVEELGEHRERYADFFDEHGITVDDPLGEFTRVPVPDAPSTPERIEEPIHPYAEGGFADDVYVETPDGDVVVGGQQEPEDVDPTDAPGVDDDVRAD
jgi:hypothetical protein